jgi:large subunit ribosomal protein L25
MAETFLKAQLREKKGKEVSHKLRAQGLIPAVLYGPSTPPIALAISLSDLLKFLGKKATASSFLDLEIAGRESLAKKKVLIKDIQFNPVTDQLIHVDFYEIAMDKELTVDVPFVLVGEAKGLERGGILDQNLRELTIFCLPHLVPSHIEIDVSSLDIGDSIHVADISVGDGIRIEVEPQVAIVSLVAPEQAPEEVVKVEEGEELGT